MAIDIYPPNPTGTSGYSGYSGTVGTSGYSGYSGKSGLAGPSGPTGPTGTSGFSGYSGAGPTGSSGFSGYSGGPTTVVNMITADVTLASSTTKTAVTDMAWTIAANDHFAYELDFNVESTDFGAGGIKLYATYPSSPTSIDWYIEVLNASNSSAATPFVQGDRTTTVGTTNAVITFNNSTFSNYVSNYQSGGASGDNITALRVIARFVIINASNAGTVQLAWAQAVSSATGMTLKRGGIGISHRINGSGA